MIKGYKDSEKFIVVKFNEKGEIEDIEVGKIVNDKKLKN